MPMYALLKELKRIREYLLRCGQDPRRCRAFKAIREKIEEEERRIRLLRFLQSEDYRDNYGSDDEDQRELWEERKRKYKENRSAHVYVDERWIDMQPVGWRILSVIAYLIGKNFTYNDLFGSFEDGSANLPDSPKEFDRLNDKKEINPFVRHIQKFIHQKINPDQPFRDCPYFHPPHNSFKIDETTILHEMMCIAHPALDKMLAFACGLMPRNNRSSVHLLAGLRKDFQKKVLGKIAGYLSNDMLDGYEEQTECLNLLKSAFEKTRRMPSDRDILSSIQEFLSRKRNDSYGGCQILKGLRVVKLTVHRDKNGIPLYFRIEFNKTNLAYAIEDWLEKWINDQFCLKSNGRKRWIQGLPIMPFRPIMPLHEPVERLSDLGGLEEVSRAVEIAPGGRKPKTGEIVTTLETKRRRGKRTN